MAPPGFLDSILTDVGFEPHDLQVYIEILGTNVCRRLLTTRVRFLLTIITVRSRSNQRDHKVIGAFQTWVQALCHVQTVYGLFEGAFIRWEAAANHSLPVV